MGRDLVEGVTIAGAPAMLELVKQGASTLAPSTRVWRAATSPGLPACSVRTTPPASWLKALPA